MRTFFRVGTIGAVVALTCGAMAGVSWADTYSKTCNSSPTDPNGVNCTTVWNNSNYSNAVATAGFTAYGEFLWAYDWAADGRGVYIYASWSGGSSEIMNTGGNGNLLEKDLSIKDGTSVSLTMCQTDNGALLNCAYGTAIA